MLAQNLAVSVGMIVLCVLIHAFGSAAVLSLVRSDVGRRMRSGAPHDVAGVLVYVVFGLMALHALEIAAYGWLYRALGEFSDWEHSLYFAATTFSSLGYGDVIISDDWRLVGSFEGVIGLILIGWSTAILAAVTSRIGLFDVHRDPPGPRP